MDKIPSPETRTELFEGATEGPLKYNGMGLIFRIAQHGNDSDHLVAEMQGYISQIDPTGRLFAAAPALLRERDTLLSRLEGRAELPEGYEFDPFMDIAGPHISLMVTGFILLSLSDTPHSRRILTGMAWAHWHASTPTISTHHRLRAEIQDIAMVNSMATAHTEQSVDAKAFLERKADQHFRQSGQFIGGNGTPVGCADFDGAVKAWALIRMRDALMEGNTLPGALLVALRESRNVIMKHNAQRPDEQRWDGMCEATLWDAYRAIKRAMNFPPNTEGRPTAGEAAQ